MLLRFLITEGPQGHPLRGWPRPSAGRGGRKSGKQVAAFPYKLATLGLEPWPEGAGVPTPGTG